MMVGYVGVLMKLCVSYALLCLGCRNSVYYMLGWQQKYASAKYRVGQVERAGGADHVRVSPNNGDGEYDATSSSPVQPLDELDMCAGADVAASVASPVKHAPSALALDPEEPALTDMEDMTYVDNIPFWKHLIVVLILATASLLLGLFLPSINMVFGFAGAISGAFIAFIFPALFYMYAGNFSVKEAGAWNFYLTYAMLICGIIGCIFGTAGTIYNTAIGK